MRRLEDLFPFPVDDNNNANFWNDGYQDYVVQTTETSLAFLSFVGIYIFLACFLIVPLSFWARHLEKTRLQEGAGITEESPDTPSQDDAEVPSYGYGQQQPQQQQQSYDESYQFTQVEEEEVTREMRREAVTSEQEMVLLPKKNRRRASESAAPSPPTHHQQEQQQNNNNNYYNNLHSGGGHFSNGIAVVAQDERAPIIISPSAPPSPHLQENGGTEQRRRRREETEDDMTASLQPLQPQRPLHSLSSPQQQLIQQHQHQRLLPLNPFHQTQQPPPQFAMSYPPEPRFFRHAVDPTDQRWQPLRNTDRASAVPSAATTSRLRSTSSPGSPPSRSAPPAMDRPLRPWDLRGMRWNKYRQPMERVGSMRRLVQAERQAEAVAASSEGGSSHASRSRSSWNSRPGGNRAPSLHRGMSNQATTILNAENVEGEAQFYRSRYINRSRRRGPSSSAGFSERSHMPPLSPDALSPDDAADRHDPGTLLNSYRPPPETEGSWSCCFWPFGGLMELTEPDQETTRILYRALPSTISALADPFFRIVLAVMITHFIDTNAMVAFVLVTLFLRLTTVELSGAITDAESTLLQDALMDGGDAGFAMVGLRMQLSVFMQFLLGVPILLIWVYVMDDVVSWLSPEIEDIGQIAADYTQIIVIDYVLQAASKAFFLIFHLTGQSQFDTNVDVCATALTIAVIAASVGLSEEPTLKSVAWIQVIIGILKILTKIVYVLVKGWLDPFRRGLVGSFSLTQRGAVLEFLSLSFPLLLGSLIELREWELLTLAVRNLGGAEVAVWALMGIIWEIFEASSEGLCESSAVRVSFHLAEGMPDQARRLSIKTVYLSMVLSVAITSLFLLLGPNISVAVTKDSTLQHLFEEAVGMIGVANLAMSTAQIYWSLVGAQSHFGTASCCILTCRWTVTMPMALVCIFAFTYDLRAVAGSVAVGYATAAGFLAIVVFRSDWNLLSLQAQEQVAGPPDEVDMESESESSSSSEDSSTGFGGIGDDSDEEDDDSDDGEF